MNLSKCTLFAILTLCACSTVDIQVDSSAASWSLPLVYGEIRVDDLVKKLQLRLSYLYNLMAVSYSGIQEIYWRKLKRRFFPDPRRHPHPLV